MQIAGFQKTTLLDFPGRVAATVFTPGCNFRCPYCHNMDIVCPEQGQLMFSEEEVLAVLEKRKKILEGVCITGGECTLQRDLEDFIRKVKAIGLPVKLDTNGSNPEIVQRLIDENLIDYVAMDIKQCKEKYNEVACYKGFSMEKIEQTVAVLMNGDIEYEFRTTIADNLFEEADIEKIGRWLAGAKAYFIQSYTESDFVLDKSCTTPSKEILQKYLSVVKEYIPTAALRGVE